MKIAVAVLVARVSFALTMVAVIGGGPATSSLGAQVQQAGLPPVRPLGPVIAVTKDSLKSILGIRVLSDGRVLINDRMASRVLLFDSSLSHPIVVADTTGETAKAYGKQGAALFPFHGDSSLFADFASLSMLVVDPSGKLGRVIAAPHSPAGPVWLNNATFGATMDASGTLVYRLQAGGRGAGIAVGRGGGASPPTADPTPVQTTDSAMLVRITIESKQMDTLPLWLMGPTQFMYQGTGPLGALRSMALKDPLATQDAWALMPDGTVAVVREHDYHIDWIAPDRSVTASPKIQHAWVRLTDSAKAAIMDSTRRADSLSTMVFRVRIDSIAADAKQHGRKVDTTAQGLIQITNAQGAVMNYLPSTEQRYIDPNDLTSYVPPFVGAPRADADGNLWILTKGPTRADLSATYDVVNREGRLVDRVQIPGGTTLVGFGKGVAYLSSREGTGLQLARARIH